MEIPRHLLAAARDRLLPGKVLLLMGARRTGKTTLSRHLQASWPGSSLSLNGDDLSVQQALASRSEKNLQALVGDATLLVLDEAQTVPDVGAILKLLVDTQPNLAVLATGSSSFDLGRRTGEPLTGRSQRLTLYPLAQCELAPMESSIQTSNLLGTRLVYGGYPEIVTAPSEQQQRELLLELVNAYLFKDILQYDGLRRADKLARLLQLLAMQIGRQVSLEELGRQLGLGRNTVERYLDLLEQCFVVMRLGGFSRNLRKEISKTSRWYFVDNGVRNALIRNFNPPPLRDDVGALWENYLMLERMKRLEYERRFANRWFWRTHDRQEIDLVEEEGGQLSGWEFKWGKPGHERAPRAWQDAYPGAGYRVIHPQDYLEFITIPGCFDSPGPD
ncbi:MAG: ATP-binding protein [Calditrichaeota bacterium]|nr:ATP-binding protein [Calditrichota bacterium]